MLHLLISKHLLKGFVTLTIALWGLHASANMLANKHPAPWQEAEKLVRQGAFDWDPRILHGTLGNGMSYVFFDSRQDTETSEATSLQIQLIVEAGATDENTDQLGVAHMVEHMSFRSTQRYPNGARAALEALGLTQGRSFNAMTNADATRYMFTLPDSKVDTAQSTLSILKEMMFAPLISATDWRTEQPIILEEWRGGLSARKNINDQKKAIIRVGSAYPERPVIGTQDSITHTPVSRIKDFHRDWYAPNNMTLVMVGAMDRAQAQSLIETTFSDVPFKALPLRKPKDPELKDVLHIDTLTDPESRLNRIAYLFRFPKIPRDNLVSRRDQLIAYLGKKLLSQQIRRQSDANPDFISLNAVKGEASPNVDLVAFGILYNPGNMAKQLENMLTEVERVRRYGFYQDDFDKALLDARQTATRNIEAAKSRGVFWLAKLNTAATNNTPLPDPRLHNELAIALLETIDLEDVNQMVRDWLSMPDRVAYLQKAGDNQHPETLNTKLVINTLKQVQDKQLTAPVAFAAIPSRTLHAQINHQPAEPLSRESTGVSQWQLANGEQLWLVETPSAGNRIRFEAVQDIGFNNTLFDRAYTQVLIQMMSNQPPKGWTPDEYDQWKKDFGVSGSWDQSEHQRIFAVTIDQQKLAAQLVTYQQLQAISGISEDVYTGYMDTLKRMDNSQVVRVSEQFRETFAEYKYGQSFTLKNELDGILGAKRQTLSQQAKALNKRPATYFVAAKNVERLLPVFNKYLGVIQRDQHLSNIAAPTLKPLVEHNEFTLNVAREPRATYRLEAFTPLQWNPNYTVMIPHLADKMNAKFKQVLRGEKQGVYSIHSDLRYDMSQQGVVASVKFTSAPERIEELNQTARDLLTTWYQELDQQWVTEQRGFFMTAQGRRDELIDTRLYRLKLSLEKFGDTRYLEQAEHLEKGFTLDNLNTLMNSLTWPSLTVGIMLPPN